MAGFKEYDRYDGLGLAELVRKKEVAPAELLEEAISRTEAGNPKLNAVITKTYDQAREYVKGKLPNGPFTGVPFLLKDLHHAEKGVRMTNGSASMRDYVPDYDAELTKRFRKTGVVFFGRTNTPEFGLLAITEPHAFGTTRNPWDTSRVPGGSSGGSGAAVAAGFAPMASASDGGGSIRIPGAHCGLFGLKPTRGRVPTGPMEGEIWDGAGQSHILCRSVRDSAAMLDAVAGHESGAPYHIARPRRAYLKEIDKPPRKLRIGFNTESPLGTKVDRECVRAVENTARLLEELGHTVEPVKQPVDGKAVATAYLTMYMGQVAAELRWLEHHVGKGSSKKVEPLTETLARLGEALPAGVYVHSHWGWNNFARGMAAFHETCDLYLIPTTAEPPVRCGELQPRGFQKLGTVLVNQLKLAPVAVRTGIIDSMAEQSLAKTPFTQLANLTGQPAMSVPLHWTPEGLPIGSQFVAPFGDEATLFALAAQLEQARPWFGRRPDGRTA